jgi:hypothetical protein
MPLMRREFSHLHSKNSKVPEGLARDFLECEVFTLGEGLSLICTVCLQGRKPVVHCPSVT